MKLKWIAKLIYFQKIVIDVGNSSKHNAIKWFEKAEISFQKKKIEVLNLPNF